MRIPLNNQCFVAIYHYRPSSWWGTHIYGNHHLVDGFFNQWLPVEPLFCSGTWSQKSCDWCCAEASAPWLQWQTGPFFQASQVPGRIFPDFSEKSDDIYIYLTHPYTYWFCCCHSHLVDPHFSVLMCWVLASILGHACRLTFFDRWFHIYIIFWYLLWSSFHPP